jgi:hypothetical protein
MYKIGDSLLTWDGVVFTVKGVQRAEQVYRGDSGIWCHESDIVCKLDMPASQHREALEREMRMALGWLWAKGQHGLVKRIESNKGVEFLRQVDHLIDILDHVPAQWNMPINWPKSLRKLIMMEEPVCTP